MPAQKPRAILPIAGAIIAAALMVGAVCYIAIPPAVRSPERHSPAVRDRPAVTEAPPIPAVATAGADGGSIAASTEESRAPASIMRNSESSPRGTTGAWFGSPRQVQGDAAREETRNDEPGGRIAPPDVPALLARAVRAEIIDEQSPLDAKEAAVIAAQQFTAGRQAREAADATAVESLATALRGSTDAEDKADLLALLSDTSERTGARIRQVIMNALRPGQPIELQRQALYLATRYNIGIVKALAVQPSHPLQQDAEAFLLEYELEQGHRPAPRDEPEPPQR